MPSELIAQMPITNKAEIAMLVFNNDKIFDKQLKNIVDYLQEGDVLVFNNAKVIKAKFSGEIERNQAKLDVNLDQEINDFSQDQYSTIWQALCKPAKKVIIGDILKIADNFFAEIIDKDNEGFIKLKFNLSSNDLVLKLEKYGQTPIPPYIKRTKENLTKDDFLDEKNYQTIYW